jgi:hypothetical protein
MNWYRAVARTGLPVDVVHVTVIGHGRPAFGWWVGAFSFATHGGADAAAAVGPGAGVNIAAVRARTSI